MTNNDNLNWPIFNVLSKPSHRNMITSINVNEEIIENSSSAYPLVDKCIIIDNSEFLYPLTLNDNINTSKSNILINEIISDNSDIRSICIFVIGISIGIYLLCKLLSSDEGFSRDLKCFTSDDNETFIKEISGPVFTKPSRWPSGGYDCEHCCCGYDCRCCCKHNDIYVDTFEGKHSRTPGTPEEEAKRAADIAKEDARQKAERALKRAELEKKEADAKASLLEWRKKAQEAQAAKKAAEEAASAKTSDVPLAWGLYFQDGASPSFEGIVDLHNRIMFYLVVILFGVTWVMVSIMRNFNKNENKLVYRYLNHGTLIELIWTVGPALVLVAIAFPSFKLLYLMDEVIDPAMTVKVTGHQWYWEYEYADFLNEENETINFDSYMKDETSLEKGELRMLEVDNPVVLPVDTHIRFIITGADVLHDWAMPSLGIKVDAAPGRLNQASVIIERTGHFYGQCSEICGVLHSSMPIKIEAVQVEKFFSWLLEQ